MAKQNEATKLTAPHKTEGFRGYTLSELRQQRLVARVRMELLKEKMTYDAAEMFKSKLPPRRREKFGRIGYPQQRTAPAVVCRHHSAWLLHVPHRAQDNRLLPPISADKHS